jgi:DNA-binding GntR family transcriptional regulator
VIDGLGGERPVQVHVDRPVRPARSLAQHEKVIEAIAAGDTELADVAMRDHIGDILVGLQTFSGSGAGRLLLSTVLACGTLNWIR